MTTGQAEILALQALGWLAQNDDLLTVFLNASGMTEQDLKTRADEADVLAAVLDFVLMDDAWVVGVCTDASIQPDMLMQARAALPGGADPHWT